MSSIIYFFFRGSIKVISMRDWIFHSPVFSASSAKGFGVAIIIPSADQRTIIVVGRNSVMIPQSCVSSSNILSPIFKSCIPSFYLLFHIIYHIAQHKSSTFFIFLCSWNNFCFSTRKRWLARVWMVQKGMHPANRHVDAFRLDYQPNPRKWWRGDSLY